MRKEQHLEMNGMVAELREFLRVAGALAEKIERIKAKTVEWENERESAETKTRQARQEAEGARAEALIAMNRLPSELAPLRNKIAEQERTANLLMTDAMRAKQEAQTMQEKAAALLAEAEKLTGKEPVKRGR